MGTKTTNDKVNTIVIYAVITSIALLLYFGGRAVAVEIAKSKYMDEVNMQLVPVLMTNDDMIKKLNYGEGPCTSMITSSEDDVVMCGVAEKAAVLAYAKSNLNILTKMQTLRIKATAAYGEWSWEGFKTYASPFKWDVRDFFPEVYDATEFLKEEEDTIHSRIIQAEEFLHKTRLANRMRL